MPAENSSTPVSESACLIETNDIQISPLQHVPLKPYYRLKKLLACILLCALTLPQAEHLQNQHHILLLAYLADSYDSFLYASVDSIISLNLYPVNQYFTT